MGGRAEAPVRAGWEFRPLRLTEVELTSALPDFEQVDAVTGKRHDRALVLVRLHTFPLGQVEIAIPEAGLSASALADAIGTKLHAEIQQHLQEDGWEGQRLQEDGIHGAGVPRCLQRREQVLRDGPTISVVISTRDRGDALRACLDSLLALEYPRYEIVVVDNAPRTSATRDLIQQWYGKQERIRYVREDRPGLSWARNRGVIESRGDIVAFTDDDVVVDSHWLAQLAAGSQVGDSVGCVTGLVLPIELETPAQVWFEQFGGFSKGFTRQIFDIGDNRPASPIFPYAAGMFGSGNNMAFHVDILRSLGGFDPSLGAGALVGGEDLDAFFRLILQGHTLVYEPGAIVHHLHRHDYASLRRQLSDGGVVGYLTKYVIENPRATFSLATKIPSGITYALSPESPKNARKRSGYPAELTRVERMGMLRAPIWCLRSRRRAGKIARAFGPLVISPIDASVRPEPRYDQDFPIQRSAAGDARPSSGNPPLRILLVAARYFPSVGGVEVHTYEVARRLTRRGHEVSVLTTDPTGDLLDIEEVRGLSIRRTPTGPRLGGYYLPRAVYDVVREGQWDVVHCQGVQGSVAPAAMLAARAAHLPYVVTLHSGGHSSLLRRATEGVQWAILKPLLAGAEYLIAVSPFEKARFLEALHLPPEKLVVIPNGSDLPRSETSTVANADSTIASIGRLQRYKGHHRVLAALPYVLDAIPDASLRIVGSGPGHDKLARQARDLGIADRVEISGISGCDRAGMAKLLSSTALVTLLSEYESQGLAVNEAIAMGSRALVAQTSALTSLVHQGLARGIDIDSSPREVARAIVEALRAPLSVPCPPLPTWDDCTDRLVALYRSICETRVS